MCKYKNNAWHSEQMSNRIFFSSFRWYVYSSYEYQKRQWTVKQKKEENAYRNYWTESVRGRRTRIDVCLECFVRFFFIFNKVFRKPIVLGKTVRAHSIKTNYYFVGVETENYQKLTNELTRNWIHSTTYSESPPLWQKLDIS